MKLFFVGANAYDRLCIESAARVHDVVVCDSVDFPHDPRARFVFAKKSFAWWQAWLSRRGSQLSLPFYLHGLVNILEEEKPDCILVHDFFRLWLIQAWWYTRRHADVKIIIRSETQRFPDGWLQRLFMKAALRFVKYIRPSIAHIFTFTD